MQVHRQFDWGRWHLDWVSTIRVHRLINQNFRFLHSSHQASTGFEWQVSEGVLFGGDVWVKQSTDKWYVDPTGATLLVDEQAVGGEAYLSARWERWDGSVGVSSVSSQLLFEEACLRLHFLSHSLSIRCSVGDQRIGPSVRDIEFHPVCH